MPKKMLPRLSAVAAAERPYSLRLSWDNGQDAMVDVSSLIDNFKFYAPLRDNPARFADVQLGEFGVDVVWPGDIDMSAESLWRLSQEQAGLTLSSKAFRDWREGRALTLDGAAAALGLSRRMIAYYEQGKKPIPRVVALATRGLDCEA